MSVNDTNIDAFCKSDGTTKDQFYGKEMKSGNLDLFKLASIPEGFNPAVIRDLNLDSLTSIPEGFIPAGGGDLDPGNGLSAPVRKPGSFNTPKTTLLSWQDGKYVHADGVTQFDVNSKWECCKCGWVGKHSESADKTPVVNDAWLLVCPKCGNKDEFYACR